jgi:hypothetical protein
MVLDDYQSLSHEIDSGSKIVSQLSTKGPEVGPYEFCCHIDAMLDAGQHAINTKKFNTMTASLLTDTYDNVLVKDVNTVVFTTLENAGATSDCIGDESRAFLGLSICNKTSQQHLIMGINLGDCRSQHMTISTGSTQCVPAPLFDIDNDNYDETQSSQTSALTVAAIYSDVVLVFRLQTQFLPLNSLIYIAYITSSVNNIIVIDTVSVWVSIGCVSTLRLLRRHRHLSSCNFDFNPTISVGGMPYGEDIHLETEPMDYVGYADTIMIGKCHTEDSFMEVTVHEECYGYHLMLRNINFSDMNYHDCSCVRILDNDKLLLTAYCNSRKCDEKKSDKHSGKYDETITVGPDIGPGISSELYDKHSDEIGPADCSMNDVHVYCTNELRIMYQKHDTLSTENGNKQTRVKNGNFINMSDAAVRDVFGICPDEIGPAAYSAVDPQISEIGLSIDT